MVLLVYVGLFFTLFLQQCLGSERTTSTKDSAGSANEQPNAAREDCTNHIGNVSNGGFVVFRLLDGQIDAGRLVAVVVLVQVVANFLTEAMNGGIIRLRLIVAMT